jgi:hypothetical protein
VQSIQKSLSHVTKPVASSAAQFESASLQAAWELSVCQVGCRLDDGVGDVEAVSIE